MRKIKNARIDPLTGEEFEPKRANQLFANRKNQITFNNRKAKANREHKAAVNTPLDNNHKVMKKVLQNQIRVQCSKEFLLGAGLDFNFITHRRTDENSIQWNCVYEFQFRQTDSDQYLIERTVISENQ